MKAALLAIAIALALVGCRERGTIDVPLVEPCGTAYADVAVYMLRSTQCDAIACGLSAFTCDGRAGCTSACPSGYCTSDDLDALSLDPAPGDYALVVSFRYPGDEADGGVACYALHVDADGDTSRTDELTSGQCCREATP